MTPDQIKTIVTNAFDEAFKEKLVPAMGAVAAEEVKRVVDTLQLQRSVTGGKDVSGLSKKMKKDFVEVARAASMKMFNVDVKSNEALISEQDNRGGYLISREVADAIMRIAASVGTIMNQTMKWEMNSDSLSIPNYTGAFLTGAYIGVDLPGTVTGLTFGQAQLIARKWQLAFVVGNDLLADASENLADWLLALAGEALANMIDQQGFIGGTAAAPGPFVGVLQASGTTGYNLATGQTSFSKFAVMDDASAMIGNLEESILDGAAFYFHRTVWAALRTQKDANGNYILPFAGLSRGQAAMQDFAGGGPIKPAGEILGYPVYTNRWLPALGSSLDTTSSKFGVFGNMKAFAFGDRGEMRVNQFESGSFGGKEIALSDQRGITYKHNHALSLVLPAAFVVAKTSAN